MPVESEKSDERNGETDATHSKRVKRCLMLPGADESENVYNDSLCFDITTVFFPNPNAYKFTDLSGSLTRNQSAEGHHDPLLYKIIPLTE